MNRSSGVLVAVLAVSMGSWVVAPAAAAPIASPLMLQGAVGPSVETVQYRRGWRGGYRGGAGIGLGIAGALIGAAIIGATQPYGYYGYSPVMVRPMSPRLPMSVATQLPIVSNASSLMTHIPAPISASTGCAILAPDGGRWSRKSRFCDMGIFPEMRMCGSMLDQTYIAPDEKRLLARFWQSASGFWRGRSAWRAWLLVTLLIATGLLQLLTQYGLNFWNRDFFNAIGRKDAADLWIQALRFVPLAATSLFLTILSVWSRMTMQRTWRAWMSNHLYDYWLEKDHYVRLRFMAGTIKLRSIGSPRTRGLRPTCRSTLCSACCRRSSPLSRLLAFSGRLEIVWSSASTAWLSLFPATSSLRLSSIPCCFLPPRC
jgi:hypothetical protein